MHDPIDSEKRSIARIAVADIPDNEFGIGQHAPTRVSMDLVLETVEYHNFVSPFEQACDEMCTDESGTAGH